jgi:hypothetical protein
MFYRSQDSLTSIATVHGFDGRGSIPAGKEIFLYFTRSRLALGPTQPATESEPEALLPGVMLPDVKLTTYLHLMPRSRIVGFYLHSPTRLQDVVLK